MNLHFLRGAILLAMGRYAEAIPAYRRSIEVQPEQMESHSNLAWILAAAPVDGVRDPEDALRLAQRACELSNHEHWMPLTALAAAHAERGEFEPARQRIDESLKLAPESERESTLKRQAEIAAGRPLRDVPAQPAAKEESTRSDPRNPSVKESGENAAAADDPRTEAD